MTTVHRVGILGATWMGPGLAEIVSLKGYEAVLVDQTVELLDGARAEVEQSLNAQLEKWAVTELEKRLILSRITFSTDFDELATCDVVIETQLGDVDRRKETFAYLDRLCKRNILLAMNTSTLSVTEIAQATSRPARVIGLHFLAPVIRTQVVEVVRGLKTSDATFHEARAFVEDLGKTGVEVYESPGFVTTRLILPMINDAAIALMEGVASAEGIDTAMSLGFEMAKGPLEIADRIGLDTLLIMLERMWREYGDLKYRPASLLRKLVRAGHLGLKTGQGFFKYDKEGRRLH